MKMTRRVFVSAVAAGAAGAYFINESAKEGAQTKTKGGVGMLKGIDPVISPELLKTLAEMGHGDEILFADAPQRCVPAAL